MTTSTHESAVRLHLENLASRAKLRTALRGVDPNVQLARSLRC